MIQILCPFCFKKRSQKTITPSLANLPRRATRKGAKRRLVEQLILSSDFYYYWQFMVFVVGHWAAETEFLG
jgi:hypothetical protein